MATAAMATQDTLLLLLLLPTLLLLRHPLSLLLLLLLAANDPHRQRDTTSEPMAMATTTTTMGCVSLHFSPTKRYDGELCMRRRGRGRVRRCQLPQSRYLCRLSERAPSNMLVHEIFTNCSLSFSQVTTSSSAAPLARSLSLSRTHSLSASSMRVLVVAIVVLVVVLVYIVPRLTRSLPKVFRVRLRSLASIRVTAPNPAMSWAQNPLCSVIEI